MQLIIVLCLIAKLALVSGDCDVGITVHNFDYNKFTGTWNFLYYQPNENEDNFDCAVDTYSVPDGNVSTVTTHVYETRQGRKMDFTGQACDWDNTGYRVKFDAVSEWNGKMYVVAVDYDRYYIAKFCSDQSDTATAFAGFRSTSPDEATMTDAKKASNDNGISFDQLKEMTGTQCR